MGKNGPPPKPNAVRPSAGRAGRAAASRARIEAAPADVPELPPPPDGEAWHPMALAWWETLSESPWRHLFQATDWQTAIRGVALVDLFWRKPAANVAAEIRAVEAKLGCTVGDRAHLGWTIDAPAPASDGGEKPKGSRSRPDPRKK